MLPGRRALAMVLITPLAVGCGAVGPTAPVIVEVPAPEDAPAESPSRLPARRVEVAPAPAPSACPTVEPKRLHRQLFPRSNGSYGQGRTQTERDCNKLLWFTYWTDEAMADPLEILPLVEGVIPDLIRANTGVVLSDPNLKAAVAGYLAALHAEKEDGYALAQAICARDTAQREAMEARLRADLEADKKVRDVMSDICAPTWNPFRKRPP